MSRRGRQGGVLDIAVPEVSRRPEPILIRVVSEEQPVAPHTVDHLARHTFTKGRTPPAATETAVCLDEVVADVRRAVHHDRALASAVIEAFVESLEPKGVAVLADVCVFGREQAEA